MGSMTHKVRLSHSATSHAHINSLRVREGVEVYRHPEGRFIVLEFEGQGGKFREAFWPEQIMRMVLGEVR